jgi:hypothetical protein
VHLLLGLALLGQAARCALLDPGEAPGAITVLGDTDFASPWRTATAPAFLANRSRMASWLTSTAQPRRRSPGFLALVLTWLGGSSTTGKCMAISVAWRPWTPSLA